MTDKTSSAGPQLGSNSIPFFLQSIVLKKTVSPSGPKKKHDKKIGGAAVSPFFWATPILTRHKLWIHVRCAIDGTCQGDSKRCEKVITLRRHSMTIAHTDVSRIHFPWLMTNDDCKFKIQSAKSVGTAHLKSQFVSRHAAMATLEVTLSHFRKPQDWSQFSNVTSFTPLKFDNIVPKITDPKWKEMDFPNYDFWYLC